MLVFVAIIPSMFSSIINWQISSISLKLRSGAILTNNGGQLGKFLISLIISGIPLNLYKNRFYDNSWTVGEWLISYSGGFIRRGLPGQVIFYLSSNFDINPIFLTWLISVSSILFLFILVRIFSWRTFDKTFLLYLKYNSCLVIFTIIDLNFILHRIIF